MMAMADQDGEVHASVLGLARQANVTLAECEAALKVFLSPDPYSRTKDHDGRRIEETDGGWLLLNFEKYREKFDQEKRREYLRRKKSESRAKGNELLTNVDSQQMSTNVNKVNTKEEEAEEEAENITDMSPQAAECGAEEAKPDPLRDFPRALMMVWNMNRGTLPACRGITDKLRAHCKARAASKVLKENGLSQPDDYASLIQFMAETPFYRGENDRQWKATFGYLVRSDDVPLSILERMSNKKENREQYAW